MFRFIVRYEVTGVRMAGYEGEIEVLAKDDEQAGLKVIKAVERKMGIGVRTQILKVWRR